MKALALLLALAAGCVQADVVGVHIGSQHYPAQSFNNANPGAYYRFDSGATFGVYINSYERTSAYAAYTHEWGLLALTGGVITGYEKPVFLAPSVKLPITQRIAARIVVLPRFEKHGSSVIHLAFEFNL